MLEGIPLEPEAGEHFASTQHMELELVGIITTDDGTLGCSHTRLQKQEGLDVK